MRCKFITLITILFILQILSWYIITIYSAVFFRAQFGLLNGGLISIIITLVGFEFSLPFIVISNRYIAMKLKLRFLYSYNYFVYLFGFLVRVINF
jgi:hypothetical protein